MITRSFNDNVIIVFIVTRGHNEKAKTSAKMEFCLETLAPYQRSLILMPMY